MVSTQPKPQRIELILRQIDALPTLPAVATRLLSLTASEDTHAREVIDLVRADPALTGKILALCRTADRGIHDETLTVDRAVILLGFAAVRNAVLSVKVFEVFEESDQATQPPSHQGGPDAGAGPNDPPSVARLLDGSVASSLRFDRTAFWFHSLAVAILAEQIAAAHDDPELKPDAAFVCGLLHDVGKLALDHVLPKSFERVVELAELNQANIAEFERRVMGIDHHTAGKRLAQQWQLPRPIADCIWLHGSGYDTLPKLAHRRQIGLISLADLLARRNHVGYSGNFNVNQDPDALAEKLGLDPAKVHAAEHRLHEELERRGQALGLHDAPSQELFLESIQRANQALGKMNQALERRSRTAAGQGRVLEAVRAFHAAATPGQGVQDTLDVVAASANQALGPGFYAMLYPRDPYADSGADDAGSTWLISQYSQQGQPQRSQCIEAPPHAPDLAGLDAHQPVGLNLMGILPWLADYLLEAQDLRQVKLLPLSCGWGTAAVLLHDREQLAPWNQLSALTATWGAAIATAAQQEAASRLGEELAEANSALAEAQDKLLRQASMARLGEMASGAAHEMNNPLAIISGRSQLLTMTLQPGSREQTAAQTIHQSAHRLSDMITALRMFADPPEPQREQAELATVLDEAIRKTHQKVGERRAPDITMRMRHNLPPVEVDREQVCSAMIELLLNAVQSGPEATVQVVAQLAPAEAEGEAQRVMIQVIDDGPGMDRRTLAHALDPFFSAKPAGRRAGLGLPRAQQWIAGHSGTLELRSTPGQGTTATVMLPMG